MPEGSLRSGRTQTVLPFDADGADVTVPSHAELCVAAGFAWEEASSDPPVATTSAVTTTASTAGFHEFGRAGAGVSSDVMTAMWGSFLMVERGPCWPSRAGRLEARVWQIARYADEDLDAPKKCSGTVQRHRVHELALLGAVGVELPTEVLPSTVRGRGTGARTWHRADIEHLFECGPDQSGELSVVERIMTVMTDTATPTSPGAPGADEWVAVGIRPDRVVAAVTDTLSQLDDTVWAARTPAELLATMRGLEQLRSVLDLVQLQVVAEIDGSGAARTEGWASAKDFVTAVTGGHAGAGRRTVALARAVTGDRAATGAALAAGAISRTQAEVIVGAVDRLPVDPGLRAGRRAAAARGGPGPRRHRPGETGGGTSWSGSTPTARSVATSGCWSARSAPRTTGRFLSIAEDGIGGVRLRGRGTVEDAAWLKAVLFPLAAPSPPVSPGPAAATRPSRPARAESRLRARRSRSARARRPGCGTRWSGRHDGSPAPGPCPTPTASSPASR